VSALPNDMLQEATIRFLGNRASYAPVPGMVERLETHGAIVFLAGDTAYKIKKTVCFPYMDFSTLELRRRVCLRELEINKPHAPDIYRDVVAITRAVDGHLAINGEGEPVEWCVRMRRFAQTDLLSAVAEQGGLDAGLCHRLAEAVVAYHRASPMVDGVDWPGRLARVADDICLQLVPQAELIGPAEVATFGARARQGIERAHSSLTNRSRDGFVRRVHGDLHLGNIVLWHGAPVLFDAIEFNEDIATIDTLYDLAFLLMDLDHRGQRASANRVLNRYLWLSRDARDVDALDALPLYLSLRAAVRALVLLQRALQAAAPVRTDIVERSREYLKRAAGYLEPSKPKLVAVGGLSGTGKSTLAAALAPLFGTTPGALHLRSDLERKALFNCAETDRLPPSTYTRDNSARVYAALLEKAGRALRAGHSVIVDAVCAAPEERAAIERLAHRLGVTFQGLWLDAPPAVLRERVTQRRGDASDATADVVDRQLALDTGSISWARLASEGSRTALLEAAVAKLPVESGV
jgi:uncharacterized protein